MRSLLLLLTISFLAGCTSFRMDYKKAAWEWNEPQHKHGIGYYGDTDIEYRWRYKIGKAAKRKKPAKKEYQYVDPECLCSKNKRKKL